LAPLKRPHENQRLKSIQTQPEKDMNRLFARFTIAALCLGTASLGVAQTPPFFNVKTYGATGNGSTIDTPAINSAIAAANAAGGGTVTFPPGNYLSVSIHLTNDVTLYLSNSAVILGASSGYDAAESNPFSQYQDYGHSHFHDSLIWGENLVNVGLEGPGTVNGNGNLTSGDPGSGQGDKALALVTCSNVTISGVTITAAGHFGILAQACTNMLVTGAHILNATANQHRDGFNLISCSHVVITNSDIEGSDDSMCLKSTYALGRKIDATDIHVSHCTILSTENNATQFGSETVGNFTDVTFSDLTITGAGKAGIGITSQDGSVIDGVTYNNITMSNCATPIWMKLDLRTTDTPNPALGAIRNISINNVVATHSTLFGRAFTSTINGYFDGSSTRVPIGPVVLNNVNVSNVGGQSSSGNNNVPNNNQDWQPQNFGSWPSYGWYLRYAENICFTNCQAHFDANDDRAAVVSDLSTNILFDGFTAQVGSSSPYDMRFTSTDGYDVINAVSTTGAALRINTSGSTTASIVPAPDFNPPSGAYTGDQSVALGSISGASINYTTDGSTPTSTSGTPYAGPIPVSSDTVIKAIAFKSGMTDSAVNTAIYSISASSNGPDFSISAAPSSQTVTPGNGTSYTVTVTDTNGFAGDVALAVSGLPAGASGNFNPATITGSGTSTLTVTTSSSTPANTSTLTITGTSGSLVHDTTVSLAVADFTVSATPSSQTVAPGSNATYTVNVGNVNGFSGTINLSASGLPSGAGASFNPVSVNNLGSSTLTVTTASSTPVGVATLTITGTSGSLSNSTTVTLNVSTNSVNFSATNEIQCVASGLAVNVSGAATTNGAPIIQSSFAGSASSLWTFKPTTNGYYQINNVNSGRDLVVQSASTASGAKIIQWSFGSSGDDQWKPVLNADGTYTFLNLHSGLVLDDPGSSTTQGTQFDQASSTGGSNQKFNIILNGPPTPDFTLSSSPSSRTVTAGSNTTYTVTVGALNGFSGSVAFTVSGLPTGAGGSFNPASVTGSGSSTLTVTTATNTAAGTYTLAITGTSGSLVHSNSVTLIVTSVGGTTVVFNATDVPVTNSGCGTSVQSDIHFSNGKWVELTSTATGQWMEFTTPTVTPGTYLVQMLWKGNNNRGQLSLGVDGATMGGTLDQYSSGQTYPTNTFGNVSFGSSGTHKIRLTVTGKNSASSGFFLSAAQFTLAAQ
jgi:hypothetical protein